MGEPSLEPPKGGCSYSGVKDATACLRARSFLGTCRFSTAVIGAVSVLIRHSSADAGTPFLRASMHHDLKNTTLVGIWCRNSQGKSSKETNASGLTGGGVRARSSSSIKLDTAPIH